MPYFLSILHTFCEKNYYLCASFLHHFGYELKKQQQHTRQMHQKNKEVFYKPIVTN